MTSAPATLPCAVRLPRLSWPWHAARLAFSDSSLPAGFTKRVSTDSSKLSRRRWRAILLALVGLLLLIPAAGPHIDGLRTHHVEYTQNVSMFVIISVAFEGLAVTLFVAAWRIWHKSS